MHELCQDAYEQGDTLPARWLQVTLDNSSSLNMTVLFKIYFRSVIRQIKMNEHACNERDKCNWIKYVIQQAQIHNSCDQQLKK